MSNDFVFRRPISPTEYMYLPMWELAQPFLMQVVLHGEGTIDPDELRRAVAVASEACPGARLRRRGGEWVDSGIAPHVRVVHNHTLRYPRLETDPVLTSSIRPSSDANIEVMLLTAEPVTLVFRIFHAVMDGTGTLAWLTRVLAALRGEQPEAMADPVADYELVRRIGAPGKPTVPTPKYRTAVGHGRRMRGMPQYLLRHRTIDMAGRGALAQATAVLAENTHGPSRFMIPVNLRRHDPALRSTANLALPLFLDIEPGEHWTDIKTMIRTGLQERRELNQMGNNLMKMPGGAARSMMRSLNWLGANFGRNMASATVSHIGRFDLAELATPGFQPTSLRFMPNHSIAMPLLFCLTESGGRTDLTVSCRNGKGVEERLEALLDKIVATLESNLVAYA